MKQRHSQVKEREENSQQQMFRQQGNALAPPQQLNRWPLCTPGLNLGVGTAGGILLPPPAEAASSGSVVALVRGGQGRLNAGCSGCLHR